MQCSRDTILLQDYASACELKKEIRHRIVTRRAMDWNLCNIKNEGSSIALIFKHGG
ncbi:MAG: hypothetical protein ACE5HO_21585 [bacterium]